MFDSLSFAEELFSSLLDASLGDFVIKVEAGDRSVLAVLGSAGEGEHQSSWDTVKFAVTLEGN